MSKTFWACQTFGLTNLENLPDRMKTCQTEYKFYIVAQVISHFDYFLYAKTLIAPVLLSNFPRRPWLMMLTIGTFYENQIWGTRQTFGPVFE